MHIELNLTYEDFVAMYELERQYYDEEFITPIKESYEWYLNRPHSYRVAKQDNKVVGFMCLFPISKHLASDILSGAYSDVSMTYQDILELSNLEMNEPNTLFLSCIVVEREYRQFKVSRMLVSSYCDLYADFYCGDVLCDNVTEDGVRFSQKLGMSKVCDSHHQSIIMCGTFETLQKLY